VAVKGMKILLIKLKFSLFKAAGFELSKLILCFLKLKLIAALSKGHKRRVINHRFLEWFIV